MNTYPYYWRSFVSNNIKVIKRDLGADVRWLTEEEAKDVYTRWLDYLSEKYPNEAI